MRPTTPVIICCAILAAVLLLIGAHAFSGNVRPLPTVARADFVLVEKSKHTMTLFFRGRLLRSYAVALGRGGLARKEHEGDARTPEGFYRIDRHLPRSRFYRALHISYPSADDAKLARLRHVDPGSAIMIHGLRNGTGWIGSWHRLFDWTNGCIAVTDGEMDEIWRAVPDGTMIEIRK